MEYMRRTSSNDIMWNDIYENDILMWHWSEFIYTKIAKKNKKTNANNFPWIKILGKRNHVWVIGLFHPTKSQNHRILKDVTVFCNMSLHRENIILTG